MQDLQLDMEDIEINRPQDLAEVLRTIAHQIASGDNLTAADLTVEFHRGLVCDIRGQVSIAINPQGGNDLTWLADLPRKETKQ